VGIALGFGFSTGKKYKKSEKNLAKRDLDHGFFVARGIYLLQ
jgi:hypothetical protein